MEQFPPCPICQCEYVYPDGDMLVCPECNHEFKASETSGASSTNERVYKDANGNILQDGDTVIIIQDLKVKGASGIKKGTKVKGIKLIEPEDGIHDISCKIAGFGAMYLKTSVVKKA